MNLTFIQWFLIASFTLNILLIYLLLFRRSHTERARFQLKSNLLSRITHELRTPLHAVIGLSQILEKEEELPPSLKKTVVSVKENGIYLLGLINDFLDLSKVEAGQLGLDIERFSIHKLWEFLLNLFAYRFQEKGINLTIKLEGIEFNSTFLGDYKKIQQILINLISNALKFTEQGQVTLRIFQKNHGKAGGALLEFAVIDSGLGISNADMKTVFEPFWQSKQKDSISGTGLGLSIAKHLVELQGGQLNVQSKLGKGSEFFFELLLTETSDTIQDTILPMELGFLTGISPEEEKQYMLSFVQGLDPEGKETTLRSLKVQEYSNLYSYLEKIESGESLGKQLFLSKLKDKKTKFLIDVYNQLRKEPKA